MRSKEIAKLLGVSEATVSLARNNRAGVSEETRKKVMALVNQLPISAGAPCEKGRRLCHVFTYRESKHALVAPEPTPAFSRMMTALNESAFTLGYFLHFMFNYPEQQSLLDTLETYALENDAGIFINDYLACEPDYSMLRKLDIPIVIFDQDTRRQKLDCVAIDNRGAAEAVTSAVLDMGHRDILYIKGAERCYNLCERHMGYIGLCAARGVRGEELTLGGDARAQLRQALESHGFTAVICEDTAIMGLVTEAAYEMGLEIGADISAACCDAVYGGAQPGTSIMRVDYGHDKQMRAAMLLMDARLRGVTGDALMLTIGCEFIPGNSVARLN